MTFRLLSAVVVACFYAPMFFMSPVGLHVRSSDAEFGLLASSDPMHLLTWLLALVAFLYPLKVNDPNKFSLRRAGLVRRFFAFVIDFHIAAILVLVPITLFTLLLEWGVTGDFSWMIERSEKRPTDVILWSIPFLMFIPLLVIFSLPMSKGKRSIGEVLLGLGFSTDVPLSLGRSCLRSMLGFITLAAGWITVPIAALRDDRCLWHDRVFNTRPLEVLDAP